jgi:hypothetical protein
MTRVSAAARLALRLRTLAGSAGPSPAPGEAI